MIKCSIKICERKAGTRGLCGLHYKRFWRKNQLKAFETKFKFFPHDKESQKIFIKENSNFNKLSDCWEWKFCKDIDGYGVIGINNKTMKIHRLSFIAFNGEIKDNLSILHSCHNTSCCNPSHLRSGTTLDNMRDKVMAGRQPNGYKHPNAKLTEMDVDFIRKFLADGVSKKQISIKFKVHLSTVYKINSGTIWRGYNAK